MVRWFAVLLGMLLSIAPGLADTIPGFGRTVDEAKVNARLEALKELQKRLAEHELTAWRPTPADIDAMIDGPGEAGRSDAEHGLRDRWNLQVRFPTVAEMELRDRGSIRQKGAAWGALAALGGFAAWWGVSRRRESSR